MSGETDTARERRVALLEALFDWLKIEHDASIFCPVCNACSIAEGIAHVDGCPLQPLLDWQASEPVAP